MKKNFTTKLQFAMKVCATQGIIAILFASIALANTSYSQLLDREVTLTLSNTSFDNILGNLSTATGARFAYSHELLNVNGNITLTADHQPLGSVLTDLLTPRNITYVLHEDGITISLKRKSVDSNQEAEGAVKNTPKELLIPLITITGTVTDANKQPLAGVNILVRGSTNGTTSDADGSFSINAETNDLLVFSFIGYASQEILVSNQQRINATLVEDSKSLNEVVINAGYWKIKEHERTGNISKVSSEEIRKQPISNPLQALQGRMPGVYIQQNSGVPGGAFKIQIRGQNSLRANGNDPLYIVDGVPFTANSLASPLLSTSIIISGSPLSSINPADIESIEILKDGDATAIYGSRGANGVVLITTKKGSTGKTRLNVSVQKGMGQVSNKLPLLSTPKYVEMRNEAFMNDGYWPIPDSWSPYTPDLLIWDTTRHTNWQKELIGNTAQTTNATLSLSGGNAQTNFVLSGGYYKETTVFPGDYNFQRLSGNMNLTHHSQNNKFQLSTSVNYSMSLNRLLPIDLTYIAVTLPPNAPALYTDDGDINWDWQNFDIQNPLSITKQTYRNSTHNLISNTTVGYEVLPGLQIKSNLGFTTMTVDELSTNPLSAIPPQFLTTQTASSNFGKADLYTWIAEPQASYTKTISKGSLNITVGSTFQQSTQSGNTFTARGYTSDALLENIKAATSIEVSSADYYKYRYTAVFGRVNYNWNERYIVNLTARRDGSSRFGTGNQFGNFGAVGAAWIFTNENFMQRTADAISFGKLRASYGITGSDAIGNYQYLPTYSPTTYPYSDRSGLTLTRLSNANYSWENNKKFEVGVDLGFLKDKLTLSTSYYLNRSSNQLVGLPLPLLSGQSSVQFNLPATVRNSGLEIQIRSTNLKRASFYWTSDFNITIPQNKLLEFPQLEIFPAYKNSYAVGKSIFTRKTFIYEGVDPQTGMYTFKDLDGDGSISSTTDREFTKQVTQQWFGGLNNSVKFKGLQLDVLVQVVKQTGLDYTSGFGNPGSLSNQLQQVTNRWTESGDDSEIQKYSISAEAANAYTNYNFSDAAIVDASFLRIKNISLSYELPATWMRKAGLSMCRVSVIGQNLFTVTNYRGMDPENRNINYLPPLRMISFGIDVTL